MINKPEVYGALVKCLEFCVTDYSHHVYDPEWDNWQLRDVVEQYCLIILGHLIDKYGVDGLVKSRFIARWLASEPFGSDIQERQSNFIHSTTKDNRLNELVIPLFKDKTGRRQLVQAKLIPPEPVSEDGIPPDVKMINGESTAGEEFEGMIADVRRRRDQSSAEDHLRRRHREAMVLNDGTRPLERGDIFQRER